MQPLMLNDNESLTVGNTWVSWLRNRSYSCVYLVCEGATSLPNRRFIAALIYNTKKIAILWRVSVARNEKIVKPPYTKIDFVHPIGSVFAVDAILVDFIS